MVTNRDPSSPVVVETTGEEVVEAAPALAPAMPSNLRISERKLVPFAETLPRIWLQPSPFARSA